MSFSIFYYSFFCATRHWEEATNTSRLPRQHRVGPCGTEIKVYSWKGKATFSDAMTFFTPIIKYRKAISTSPSVWPLTCVHTKVLFIPIIGLKSYYSHFFFRFKFLLPFAGDKMEMKMLAVCFISSSKI